MFNDLFFMQYIMNNTKYIKKLFCVSKCYNIWSSLQAIYWQISCIWQLRIRQRSLRVVVFRGLFLRNLSMVELDIWCLWIKVYVDSVEFFSVFQNGLYSIMVLLRRKCISFIAYTRNIIHIHIIEFCQLD